jgi:DNA-binding LacI/PurR family transcriptional regulator
VPPSQPSTKPATSFDVARRAGVSRSTVSNILNGNDARFPQATRERVLTAAKELDYRPSLAGRSLVSGRSDTIVVLLPNTTFGSNLQDAVDEAVASTTRFGGNVVVRFAGESPRATINAIAALRPLAVLAFSDLPDDDLKRLEAAGTMVLGGRSSVPGAPIDGGIARLQANALLERGPRPLWFASLSDRRQDPYGPPRFAALQEFCESEALPPPAQIEVPLNVAEATRALTQVMSRSSIAGVVCYNDDVAMALLAAAREMSVSVPHELSVVGVDHTAVGQLWTPRLTTVDTNLRGLVAGYSAELEARLAGTAKPPELPEHHFTVIRGETT